MVMQQGQCGPGEAGAFDLPVDSAAPESEFLQQVADAPADADISQALWRCLQTRLANVEAWANDENRTTATARSEVNRLGMERSGIGIAIPL